MLGHPKSLQDVYLSIKHTNFRSKVQNIRMSKISTASMKKNRRRLRVFLTMGGGWAKKGLMGKFFALVVKIPHYMEC